MCICTSAETKTTTTIIILTMKRQSIVYLCVCVYSLKSSVVLTEKTTHITNYGQVSYYVHNTQIIIIVCRLTSRTTGLLTGSARPSSKNRHRRINYLFHRTTTISTEEKKKHFGLYGCPTTH